MTEFRIRRQAETFWVWQLETGRRYVRVETPFASRREAAQWVAAVFLTRTKAAPGHDWRGAVVV